MTSLLKKITHRLSIHTVRRLETYQKRNQYAGDENYDIASVDRCYEGRADASGDDTALLKRIIAAYQRASADLLKHSEVFRPSNEWLPIYRNNLREIIAILESGDVAGLDKAYRNFWRDPCSTGLIGLPVDMRKAYFRGKISHVNKLLHMNDSVHRFNLWKKLVGDRFTVDRLDSPLIGNPYGYFVAGRFIKAGSDYQHYYATRIIDLLGEKQQQHVVAEIGAGFGGMAYYLIRDAGNTVYVDFDLPENLALTSYYLMKAFPEKRILLYGEGKLNQAALASYDIVLMPTFSLDDLPAESCALVFNSYSLAEMSADTIAHYVRRAAEVLRSKGHFLHVNHVKHSVVSARTFPIPPELRLISEEFAAWNLGRNSNMDEYEFLYQKS